MIVEAQSTYGEYFDKRSVKEMAEYLGFHRAGCDSVDMTLDADEVRRLGPALGHHTVSRAWREADFRISFAKNKTHSYAYYSLTIKNIYGALPLANKFKEYHCGLGIYETTIEYLREFPVHYGLVDAWLSADGTFRVFADPVPNETRTVIGGTDLVAVDWVGATRDGYRSDGEPAHATGCGGIWKAGDRTGWRCEPVPALAKRTGVRHCHGTRRNGRGTPIWKPALHGFVTNGREAIPAQEQFRACPNAPLDNRSAASHLFRQVGRDALHHECACEPDLLLVRLLTLHRRRV